MKRTGPPNRPIEERFWEKVFKTDYCWLWIGAKTGISGYGVIQECGRYGTRRQAHRVSYEIANGSFNKSLFVCHKCDNPSCVRPDHLFLGTQTDNMQDCSKKGRTGKDKRTKPFKLIDPSGNIITGINLADYARARGFNQGALYNVMTGRAKHAYGYTRVPE